jgi:hypothetical protein
MPDEPRPEPRDCRSRRPLSTWLLGFLAAASAVTGSVFPPPVDDECPFCLWEPESA